MRMASLAFLAITVAISALFAQNIQNPSNPVPNSTTNSPVDQSIVRQKYRTIQIDEFDVKQGIEFPPEYLKKAHDEIVKQLSNAKIFDEVLQARQQPARAGTPVIRLGGTIHSYTPGSRSKRYIGGGFGAGNAEVDAQLAFVDAATGQRLRTEELRAVFTGGVFGGSEDKIADELARRVVLQTRFMLDRKIPPASGTTMSNSAPPSPAPDRHTLTMNAKNWSEGEQKLEQEAAAGYRVVDFSLTGKWTADVELEKLATPPDLYQYRWVHIHLFTHLQKEVNKSTADGFHAVAQTLAGLGPYLTVLMEKPPGPATINYQYLVTEPMSMSHAQKDAETHQREGFTLLDETEFGAHILLFEKTSEGSRK